MTKKHYEIIAEALLASRPNTWQTLTDVEQWELTRTAIIEGLAADNPRFNRETFINASGPKRKELS